MPGHTLRWTLALLAALHLTTLAATARGDTGVAPAEARSAPVPAGLLGIGAAWETPWYVIEADEPGPTLMIVAGIHGNEPAGVVAAEAALTWPLRRGRLVVLPRANVPGLDAERRRIPDREREMSDLNRNFPRTGDPHDRTAGPIAAAVWDLVRQVRPDWLLDLHEGRDFRASGSTSVGNSVIFLDDPELTPVAQGMIDAVNADIADEARRFVLLKKSGGADGSLLRAVRERLGVRAMLIETTHTRQPLALRTAQHRAMVAHVMRHLGMLHPGDAPAADRARQPLETADR